jgi:hypothetical protein
VSRSSAGDGLDVGEGMTYQRRYGRFDSSST